MLSPLQRSVQRIAYSLRHFSFHKRYSLSANRYQKGSVLLTVIWTLALLSIFTLALYRQVSQELLMGQWMRDRVLSRALAKAGIERTLLEIQGDEFLTFDALNESWAKNDIAFKQVEMPSGEFWVSCDLPVSEEESDSIIYGACDESGKLNLNKASEEELTTLIMLVQEDPDGAEATIMAQSIIDWRDEDDAAMTHGAEKNLYESLKKHVIPPNGPLESVEELTLIRGINEEIYRRMKPFVTVYTKGKVNFNTAPLIVLKSLGLSHALAVNVIDFRMGGDMKQGTVDDHVFQMVESITPALSSAGTFTGEDFEQITNLISLQKVSVKSEAFRIRALGRFIKNSRSFDTIITCVAKRDGQMLYWFEGA